MKSMWDVVLGMREISGILEQWGMDVRDLRRRLILTPTPRERERRYAISLLAQGWSASGVAEVLERDPHTIGRWATALGEGGPAALIFEQPGGSPRPRRDTAGGTEGGSPKVAGGSRHRIGQLELERGPSIYLGTLRRLPKPQSKAYGTTGRNS